MCEELGVSQPSIDKRIFVVGVPRAGTTLVQSLLATHSTVTSFTESHFFSRHFRLLPVFSMPILVNDPGPRIREFLLENDFDDEPSSGPMVHDRGGDVRSRLVLPWRTQDVARQLVGVLDACALRRGYGNWIEKTALHLHYVPFLERLGSRGPGPPPHFVHVIREGLDVVSSLYLASQRWVRQRYPFARGPVPPYDLRTCARRWNTDVALSLSRVSSPTDHFIFYEDLVARPAATLQRLLEQLGLSWEPRILDNYARTASELITPSETWKAVGQRVRQSKTVHRTLTSEQIELVIDSLRHDLYTKIHERANAGGAAENQPEVS